jgi:diadenosine tetraphosphate (Ap4A) HIT family hydrolase
MDERPACPFCEAADMILENSLAYALYDTSPVSRGHLLILPRRHVSDWFDTTSKERQALWALTDEARGLLLREFAPDGFNIGINVGQVAGQTIFHVHVHLIPRYQGDVSDPRGGVRAVIPGKQRY